MDQWFKGFKDNLERQAKSYLTKQLPDNVYFRSAEQASYERKIRQLQERKAQIVQSTADEEIISVKQVGSSREVEYTVSYKLLIQQKDGLYTEEISQRRKSLFDNEKLVDDYCLDDESHASSPGGGQNGL